MGFYRFFAIRQSGRAVAYGLPPFSISGSELEEFEAHVYPGEQEEFDQDVAVILQTIMDMSRKGSTNSQIVTALEAAKQIYLRVLRGSVQ